jgi:hypothetical protein
VDIFGEKKQIKISRLIKKLKQDIMTNKRRIYDDGGVVANTILQQLGGAGRLRMMTGAYNFIDLKNGLSFRLKNPRANYVKIMLNGMDLYDVEVGRIRGDQYKVVAEQSGLYFDQLKPFIEKNTGLYLSLAKGGKIAKGGNLNKLLKEQQALELELTDIKFGSDLTTDEGVEKYRKSVAPVRAKLNEIDKQLEALGYEPYADGGTINKFQVGDTVKIKNKSIGEKEYVQGYNGKGKIVVSQPNSHGLLKVKMGREQGFTDLNDYGHFPPNDLEKINSNKMAKGGFVGKGELVWKKLSSSQKKEFLNENFTPEITPRSQETLVGKAWNFLPNNVKLKFQAKYANIEEYAKGGKLRKRFDEGGEIEDKIKHINESYDGVTASKAYSSNRIQVVSPYFNTLSEIKRNEFGGSGVMEKYGNTSSYVLYSNKAYFDDGGELDSNKGRFAKWQDAGIGDSAWVKAENKTGLIIQNYGRKFHLKFIGGAEKTYNASELEFIIDEFAEGGEVYSNHEIVVISKGLEKDGGQVVKDRFLIHAKTEEDAKKKAIELWMRENSQSDFHIKKIMTDSEYREEYLSNNYVAVSEKDGYWIIVSKPTTKEDAKQMLDGISRGESGKVVTLEEAKAHKKVIGREYLSKGGKVRKRFDEGGMTDKDADDMRFQYMMLSRLRSDCDYYLGYGHRSANNLWADSVDEHIAEMKRLWNGFPEDKKPEWLTMDEILEYETKMKSDKMAKGGIVVTSIKDIPNLQEKIDAGKVTYRGLGMGKLSKEFYEKTNDIGYRIKVDGKEYFITDTEFDTVSRGADGKLKIKFDAPYRQYADGGSVVERKYELGDKYSDDFDYTGMLEMALTAKTSWGVKKLRMLYDSFEDVNYAVPIVPLWDAMKSLEKGEKEEAEKLMEQFHERVQYMLDSTVDINFDVTEGGYSFEYEFDGEEYSGTIIIHADERRGDSVEFDEAPENWEEMETVILDEFYIWKSVQPFAKGGQTDAYRHARYEVIKTGNENPKWEIIGKYPDFHAYIKNRKRSDSDNWELSMIMYNLQSFDKENLLEYIPNEKLITIYENYADGGEVDNWEKGSTIPFKNKKDAQTRLNLLKNNNESGKTYKNLKIQKVTDGWVVNFYFQHKMADGGITDWQKDIGKDLGDGFHVGEDVYMPNRKMNGVVVGLIDNDLEVMIWDDNGKEVKVAALKNRVIKQEAPEYASGGIMGGVDKDRRKIKYRNFEEQIVNTRKFKELIVKAYDAQPKDDMYPYSFIESTALGRAAIVSYNGKNHISGRGEISGFPFLNDKNFIEALKYVDRPKISRKRFADGGKILPDEIKVGNIYYNTTTSKNVIIDEVGSDSVTYHVHGEKKSYKNSNTDSLSTFKSYLKQGAFEEVFDYNDGNFSDEYANGGEIKNSYDGKTPEDIWNSLSKGQRQHFIYDHAEAIEEYRGEQYGDLSSKEILKAYNSNYDYLDEHIKNRFENHTREGQYAKGGVLKYYDKDNEHRLGRPSGSIDKEYLEKVKHYAYSEKFVGNFGWKTQGGKLGDGYLYTLDEYDTNLVKNVTLKKGEKIFRYLSYHTAIGGMTPLIKINLDKDLLYFLIHNDNDDIVFETKGIKALWIALIEHKMKLSSGGKVRRRFEEGSDDVGFGGGFDQYGNPMGFSNEEQQDLLKEDDFVWNALGKKLVVDKVTDSEYYLSSFGQPSASPFSKEKVDGYINSGEWTLHNKFEEGGTTKKRRIFDKSVIKRRRL